MNNNDLVSGSCDSTLKIWNTNDGSVKFTLNLTTDCVNGLVQLKNGNLVAINSNWNIYLWNPFTGSLIQKKNTADNQASIFQLNNEDLSVGNQGQVKLYDSIQFQTKNTLSGQNAYIWSIIQLENDDLVSGSQDKTILIWDWNTKSVKFNLTGHSNQVKGLSLLRNGYLVSGGLDSKIIIWK